MQKKRTRQYKTMYTKDGSILFIIITLVIKISHKKNIAYK